MHSFASRISTENVQPVPQLFVANYFDDLVGVNLHHAVESYNWGHWRPVTSDGVTVMNYWDFDRAPELPSCYSLDSSGAFVVLHEGAERH